MTREEARKLLPIIQAYAEGKKIEYSNDNGKTWFDLHNFEWYYEVLYRIKPEAKYRPFKTREECWQEMQRHNPFGWVYDKINNVNVSICYISNGGAALTSNVTLPFDEFYDIFVFADGTPFGVKEE